MIATLSNKKKNRLPQVLEHASGDKRFKILEVHMKKHQFKQDALIEVLHKAQELFGYLEDDLLLFIAYGSNCRPAAFTASPRSTISSPSNPRASIPASFAWHRLLR